MYQIKESLIGVITSDLKKVRFLQVVTERKVGHFSGQMYSDFM